MLKNFTLQTPTKIIFGHGAIGAIKREIPSDSRLMLIYGCNSLKNSGVYERIKKALEGHKIISEFSGISANPEFEYLLKAAEIAKTEKVDYILAAGGGSVIDSAKFIAAAACYDGDPWRIVESFGACIRSALPVAAIVTLPASGSEVNRDAVISRASKKAKLPMGNPLLYPQFAILDPVLTFTLPKEQTASGILDTFAHVLEQYLTTDENAKLQDRFAESILQTLIEDGPVALDEPENYEARSNLMLSSTMAMNGFLRAGVPMDWSSHMISHEFTSLLKLSHAQALAIVMPKMMKYCREAKWQKLLQYAKRVWFIKEGSEAQIIDAVIEKTEAFFQQLGFKTELSDYNIGSKELEKIVRQLKSHQMIKLGEHRNINPDDLSDIFGA